MNWRNPSRISIEPSRSIIISFNLNFSGVSQFKISFMSCCSYSSKFMIIWVRGYWTSFLWIAPQLILLELPNLYYTSGSSPINYDFSSNARSRLLFASYDDIISFSKYFAKVSFELCALFMSFIRLSISLRYVINSGAYDAFSIIRFCLSTI